MSTILFSFYISFKISHMSIGRCLGLPNAFRDLQVADDPLGRFASAPPLAAWQNLSPLVKPEAS